MFIQNLRANTAHCHKQLESNDLSLALLSDNVNQKIYFNYLLQLYSFVKGFEIYIYPLLTPHFLNIQLRKKAHFIEEDLRICKFDQTPITLLQASFFKETYPDIYSAAGALYVLEGSTLGGQIIVKHLHKNLANNFNNSAYFSAYGQKTGSMWKEFLQQLNNIPQSPLQEQQIIIGAISTFKIIDGLLSNISPKIVTHEN